MSGLVVLFVDRSMMLGKWCAAHDPFSESAPRCASWIMVVYEPAVSSCGREAVVCGPEGAMLMWWKWG